MTALISKIAELKQEQSVIENLINRVQALENMPDETKKQLSEYLHDFTITDQRLKELNTGQIQFHKDCLAYLRQFNTVLANKQVVVDEGVINDIKNLVETQTGFNLRDYVTDVQRQLITNAFNNLASMQQKFAKQQQDLIGKMELTIQKQDVIIGRMDELDNRVRGYLSDIMIIVGFIGGLALLLTVPSYVLAFNRHPVLTVVCIIIAVLTCGFAGYSAFGSDDHDN